MSRKTINKIILFLILAVPSVVNAADYLVCGDDKKIPLAFADVFSVLLVIVKIILPILLVIISMISFLKAMFSQKPEEELKGAKDKLIRNILAAIIIFFSISIVSFIISLVKGKDNEHVSCVQCLFSPDKCDKYDGDLIKLCPGLYNEQEDFDENCVYIGERHYASSNNNRGYGNAGEFLNWKQCDPKWASITMGPSSTTLCKAGCTTTSISILMAKSGAVTNLSTFSPVTLAKSLQYSNGGAIKYWNDYNSWKSYAPSFKFVGQYSISGSVSDKARAIKQHLDSGEYVMIVVRNGGHYVAADRVDGNTVYIHDPGCNATDLFKTYPAAGVNTIVVYKRER